MAQEETQMNTAPARQLSGVVVSAKNDKTLLVEVERKVPHKLYGKPQKKNKKFQVHDEKNQYQEGDTVEFVECRPMSKTKRWRVLYSEDNN